MKRLLLPNFFLAALCGCGLARIAPEPRTPMPSELLHEPGASGCLAVLLPGRWDRMEAFRRAGFASRAEAVGAELGLVVVDAHIGYYRDEVLVPRLHRDVIEPVRTRFGDRAGAQRGDRLGDRPGAPGSGRIWLVGTSLGAVGSLVYWRSHPGEVAGLVLIAPYLGEDEVLDEIRRAGSLQRWSPPLPLAEDDFGRRIWRTLRDATAPGSPVPVLLAYGTRDDFAPGHRLLARELPESRVFTRPGGHDWATWGELWGDVLASGAVCEE